jgi:D-sedoheptulose 7-phosphate isomerase
MDFSNEVGLYFSKLKKELGILDKIKISKFASVLLRHYDKESNVFIFGNGGSGATASHVVCDFNKCVCLDLEKKFKFVCLNDNVPSLMAYANDINYDDVFYQQLKSYLKPGDLVIGISGSGNSKNVIKAVEYAKHVGIETFTLCGYNGGKLRKIDSTNSIHVKINDMQIVEDCHFVIFHMLLQILHKHLHG